MKAPDPLLDVLARTIQVEAAYGPARGFDAVGAAIFNRALDARDRSLAEICFSYPCWFPRADGRAPAQAAPRAGRSYEQSRRVARQILRGKHVDPTLGATAWMDVEEGPPPASRPSVRIGGRWFFDPMGRRSGE